MPGADLPRVPMGLRELMKSLTKEVLREKPLDIYEFSVQYFESKLQDKQKYNVETFEPPANYETIIKNRERNQVPLSLVYSIIPESLTELIKEFIKAVLRENPPNICEFAVEYFRKLQQFKDIRQEHVRYTAYEEFLNRKDRTFGIPYAKCACGRILGQSIGHDIYGKYTDLKHISSKEISFENINKIILEENTLNTKYKYTTNTVRNGSCDKHQSISEYTNTNLNNYNRDHYIKAIYVIQRFIRQHVLNRRKGDKVKIGNGLKTQESIQTITEKEKKLIRENPETKSFLHSQFGVETSNNTKDKEENTNAIDKYITETKPNYKNFNVTQKDNFSKDLVKVGEHSPLTDQKSVDEVEKSRLLYVENIDESNELEEPKLFKENRIVALTPNTTSSTSYENKTNDKESKLLLRSQSIVENSDADGDAKQKTRVLNKDPSTEQSEEIKKISEHINPQSSFRIEPIETTSESVPKKIINLSENTKLAISGLEISAKSPLTEPELVDKIENQPSMNTNTDLIQNMSLREAEYIEKYIIPISTSESIIKMTNVNKPENIETKPPSIFEAITEKTIVDEPKDKEIQLPLTIETITKKTIIDEPKDKKTKSLSTSVTISEETNIDESEAKETKSPLTSESITKETNVIKSKDLEVQSPSASEIFTEKTNVNKLKNMETKSHSTSKPITEENNVNKSDGIESLLTPKTITEKTSADDPEDKETQSPLISETITEKTNVDEPKDKDTKSLSTSGTITTKTNVDKSKDLETQSPSTSETVIEETNADELKDKETKSPSRSETITKKTIIDKPKDKETKSHSTSETISKKNSVDEPEHIESKLPSSSETITEKANVDEPKDLETQSPSASETVIEDTNVDEPEDKETQSPSTSKTVIEKTNVDEPEDKETKSLSTSETISKEANVDEPEHIESELSSSSETITEKANVDEPEDKETESPLTSETITKKTNVDEPKDLATQSPSTSKTVIEDTNVDEPENKETKSHSISETITKKTNVDEPKNLEIQSPSTSETVIEETNADELKDKETKSPSRSETIIEETTVDDPGDKETKSLSTSETVIEETNVDDPEHIESKLPSSSETVVQKTKVNNLKVLKTKPLSTSETVIEETNVDEPEDKNTQSPSTSETITDELENKETQSPSTSETITKKTNVDEPKNFEIQSPSTSETIIEETNVDDPGDKEPKSSSTSKTVIEETNVDEPKDKETKSLSTSETVIEETNVDKPEDKNTQSPSTSETITDELENKETQSPSTSETITKKTNVDEPKNLEIQSPSTSETVIEETNADGLKDKETKSPSRSETIIEETNVDDPGDKEPKSSSTSETITEEINVNKLKDMETKSHSTSETITDETNVDEPKDKKTKSPLISDSVIENTNVDEPKDLGSRQSPSRSETITEETTVDEPEHKEIKSRSTSETVTEEINVNKLKDMETKSHSTSETITDETNVDEPKDKKTKSPLISDSVIENTNVDEPKDLGTQSPSTSETVIEETNGDEPEDKETQSLSISETIIEKTNVDELENEETQSPSTSGITTKKINVDEAEHVESKLPSSSENVIKETKVNQVKDIETDTFSASESIIEESNVNKSEGVESESFLTPKTITEKTNVDETIDMQNKSHPISKISIEKITVDEPKSLSTLLNIDEPENKQTKSFSTSETITDDTNVNELKDMESKSFSTNDTITKNTNVDEPENKDTQSPSTSKAIIEEIKVNKLKDMETNSLTLLNIYEPEIIETKSPLTITEETNVDEPEHMETKLQSKSETVTEETNVNKSESFESESILTSKTMTEKTNVDETKDLETQSLLTTETITEKTNVDEPKDLETQSPSTFETATKKTNVDEPEHIESKLPSSSEAITEETKVNKLEVLESKSPSTSETVKETKSHSTSETITDENNVDEPKDKKTKSLSTLLNIDEPEDKETKSFATSETITEKTNVEEPKDLETQSPSTFETATKKINVDEPEHIESKLPSSSEAITEETKVNKLEVLESKSPSTSEIVKETKSNSTSETITDETNVDETKDKETKSLSTLLNIDEPEDKETKSFSTSETIIEKSNVDDLEHIETKSPSKPLQTITEDTKFDEPENIEAESLLPFETVTKKTNVYEPDDIETDIRSDLKSTTKNSSEDRNIENTQKQNLLSSDMFPLENAINPIISKQSEVETDIPKSLDSDKSITEIPMQEPTIIKEVSNLSENVNSSESVLKVTHNPLAQQESDNKIENSPIIAIQNDEDLKLNPSIMNTNIDSKQKMLHITSEKTHDSEPEGIETSSKLNSQLESKNENSDADKTQKHRVMSPMIDDIDSDNIQQNEAMMNVITKDYQESLSSCDNDRKEPETSEKDINSNIVLPNKLNQDITEEDYGKIVVQHRNSLAGTDNNKTELGSTPLLKESKLSPDNVAGEDKTYETTIDAGNVLNLNQGNNTLVVEIVPVQMKRPENLRDDDIKNDIDIGNLSPDFLIGTQNLLNSSDEISNSENIESFNNTNKVDDISEKDMHRRKKDITKFPKDPLLAETHLKSFKLPNALEALSWYDTEGIQKYYETNTNSINEQKTHKAIKVDSTEHHQISSEKNDLNNIVEEPQISNEEKGNEIHEMLEDESIVKQNSDNNERTPTYLYGVHEPKAHFPQQNYKKATAYTISFKDDELKESEFNVTGTKSIPSDIQSNLNDDHTKALDNEYFEPEIELESPTELFAELSEFEGGNNSDDSNEAYNMNETYTVEESMKLRNLAFEKNEENLKILPVKPDLVTFVIEDTTSKEPLHSIEVEDSNDDEDNASSTDSMLQTIIEVNESETPRNDASILYNLDEPENNDDILITQLSKNEEDETKLKDLEKTIIINKELNDLVNNMEDVTPNEYKIKNNNEVRPENYNYDSSKLDENDSNNSNTSQSHLDNNANAETSEILINEVSYPTNTSSNIEENGNSMLPIDFQNPENLREPDIQIQWQDANAIPSQPGQLHANDYGSMNESEIIENEPENLKNLEDMDRENKKNMAAIVLQRALRNYIHKIKNPKINENVRPDFDTQTTTTPIVSKTEETSKTISKVDENLAASVIQNAFRNYRNKLKNSVSKISPDQNENDKILQHYNEKKSIENRGVPIPKIDWFVGNEPIQRSEQIKNENQSTVQSNSSLTQLQENPSTCSTNIEIQRRSSEAPSLTQEDDTAHIDLVTNQLLIVSNEDMQTSSVNDLIISDTKHNNRYENQNFNELSKEEEPNELTQVDNNNQNLNKIEGANENIGKRESNNFVDKVSNKNEVSQNASRTDEYEMAKSLEMEENGNTKTPDATDSFKIENLMDFIEAERKYSAIQSEQWKNSKIDKRNTKESPDTAEVIQGNSTEKTDDTVVQDTIETNDNDIDVDLSEEDSLRTMTEKLRETDNFIERMQNRRMSEIQQNLADNRHLTENNFDDPRIAPLSASQPDSLVDMDDGVVLAKLQMDESRESSAQSDSVIYGEETFSTTPLTQSIEETARSSLKRLHTVPGDDASFLYKTVTIDKTIKYIETLETESEITIVTNSSSLSLDEHTSEKIRKHMMAYSLSEADSDQDASSFANELNNTQENILRQSDFNVSTALLDNNDETSTETESTIVSATTKIQAIARGFLTRKRLRRASGDTKSSVPEDTDKVSFGNEAIDESLEKLIEDAAARKIQTAYRRHYRQTHLKSQATRERTVDSSLAARRQTLQRGDALRNDSTPDEDNANKQIVPATQRHERDENSQSDTPAEYIQNFPKIPPRTNDSSTKRSFDKADYGKKTADNKMKWFALRQNSMPVQIDSEVFRVIPKNMRKRVKSAEDKKKIRRNIHRD